MSFKIKIITATDGKIAQAYAIRNTVFTLEQKIPATLDKDGLDEQAYHALGFYGYRPVATGRCVIRGNKATLARIAVLPDFRGRGYAGLIVKSLEQKANTIGVRELELYPHSYLQSFYEKLGYRQDITFTDTVAGYALVRMSKKKPS